MNTPDPTKIPKVFRWETRVATVDVGFDRLLTPSAQLRFQQEAGELHFGLGGLGFEALAALGFAFVVVQNNTVVYRRPSACEAITVSTWSEGVKGVKFIRRYRFTDAAGELLMDSLAVFVLVDVREHRILRPSDFPFAVPHAPDEPHTCPLPPRLKESSTVQTVGTMTVGRSLLDFNGHLNNTRYADILTDLLDEQEAMSLKGFSITFSHEAKLGDTLTLGKEVLANGDVLVQAKTADGVCFLAEWRTT